MDVIIIGAGAAGLMAARILSAKGINILVLEARARLSEEFIPLITHSLLPAKAVQNLYMAI